MDKLVLKNAEQFKRFTDRVFGRVDFEEPKSYPCLCVYICDSDWDRCGDLDIKVLDFVYLEDFNKRHRRERDIKAAKTRRENKKAAKAWRLKEPETFAGMSDGEVLNFVFKRIMDNEHVSSKRDG